MCHATASAVAGTSSSETWLVIIELRWLITVVSAGGFQCTGYQFNGQFGINGMMGMSGFGGRPGFAGGGISGFGGGGFQIGGFGGIGGIGGGIGGINGGIGGGGFAGAPSVAGFQGSFSHPFVGGQMGMSFGFNRDFGPPSAGVGPIGAPLPGLGIGDEVVRRDFADSAFWTANLRTDKTGKATAAFKVPDSLTNWRVQVVAVSPKMHVGTATSKFKTSRPVMIWPMLPRAFAEGDAVSVFGTVHNLTDQEQNVRVHLKAENGQVMSGAEQIVKVPAKGNVPVYWTYKAGKPGMTDLLMSAKCDAGSDASLKKLPVVASTIPERVTASGLVGKDDLTIVMPAGFDSKTAQVSVTVAPTLAADLADTLPYLVDYPYGCVEQTMSRFLPALRVAAILKQSGISTIKQLEEKLPKVVEMGQKRLIELQQADGGWAWQGNGQTHEMMTPYALFGLIQAEEAGYPCPNRNTIINGVIRLDQYLKHMADAWAILDNPNAKPQLGANKPTTQINDSLYCLYVFAHPACPMLANPKDDTKRVPVEWWPRIEKGVGSPLMSDYGHALALELAVREGKKELAEKLAKELRARGRRNPGIAYSGRRPGSRAGATTPPRSRRR